MYQVLYATIKQLETNVSLITIYCLWLFVVYIICNVAGSEVIVDDTCVPSLIVIGTGINQIETN